MDTSGKTTVTAVVDIMAPVETVWSAWNTPEDIMQWGNITDEWQTTKVENDLRPGGSFSHNITLKDGVTEFNFGGTYDEVVAHQLIRHTLGDGRTSTITFETKGNIVRVTETFEPTETEAIELQSKFCQVGLNSFKRFVEAKAGS